MSRVCSGVGEREYSPFVVRVTIFGTEIVLPVHLVHWVRWGFASGLYNTVYLYIVAWKVRQQDLCRFLLRHTVVTFTKPPRTQTLCIAHARGSIRSPQCRRSRRPRGRDAGRILHLSMTTHLFGAIRDVDQHVPFTELVAISLLAWIFWSAHRYQSHWAKQPSL
jgi:hypothetical protein